jgi:hypothetical protein
MIIKENKIIEEKEGFGSSGSILGWTIYAILHFVAFIVAVVLSFKCLGKFSLWAFFFAFCCPWLYLIYLLIAFGTKSCPTNMNPNKYCKKSVKTFVDHLSVALKDK